jgi:lactoylglutathione lyase
MELGAFSMSLSVSDLARSRAFYGTLGFEVTGGDESSWLILRNGEATIGLFQGLFEGNIITFNPGLNQDMSTPESFTDVREIQRSLREAGIEPLETVDEGTSGPGHITLVDPDGNAILIDQFA